MKSNISKYLAIIISISIIVSHFLLPFYKDYFFTNELSWDIFSYYLYLPLTFIYNDIGISDYSIIQNIMDTYHNTNTFYQAFQIDNGNFVINYMCGFAILFSPFFFIGHLWAYAGGYPTDGFSFPYQFSVSTGVYIYIICGIFIFRKILLMYFNDKTTSLVLLIMLLGTNYFNEAVRANLMPHGIMFAFVGLFVYLTIKWHSRPTVSNSYALGTVYALMVLARPSEILLIIFPILLNVYNWNSLKAKISFFISNGKYLLVAIAGCIIICIPQFIYWCAVTGKFIFFSYQNTEGFNFLEPHLIESLFSFKNSWIIYTPIIIIPLMGFFVLYKRNIKLFYPIFIFIVVNFYILSSWLAWWNGGGFGMRYFVESYVMLGICTGYFLNWMLEKKLFVRALFFGITTLLISFNLFQTWQAANYIMPHDQRNFAFWKANLTATRIKTENVRLLDIERTYESNQKLTNEEDYNIRTLGFYNFENVNTGTYNKDYIDTSVYYSTPNSYILNESNPYSPGINIPFGHVTDDDHFWVRFSLKFMATKDLKEHPAAIIITMEYNKRNFYYRSFELSDYSSGANEWSTASVDYLTPYPFSYKNEKIVAYVWSKSDNKIFVDDLKVEILERKY